jgi:tetratricopeptide (TPR) repeat protein
VPSQSPETAQLTNAYSDAWAAVNRLIREGKSWSGREPDTVYVNLGDGTFADVSFVSGVAFGDDMRAFARTDWDGDGDLDYWIVGRTAPRVRFVRNDSPRPGASLDIELAKSGANRKAIGARVDVTAGGKRLVRLVQAGSGYLSQSSTLLDFGTLPEAPEKVVVTWPDGTKQEVSGVGASGRFRIAHGEASAGAAKAPALATALKPGAPKPEAATETARIALVVRPTPAPMELVDSAGAKHAVGGGRPLLVSLWSSTCSVCLAELGEWNEARERIEKSGLRLLALSANEPADATTTPEQIVQKLAPWYATGKASSAVLDALELLQLSLVDRRRTMGVPTSFLFDARGRLAYVYKGRVALDTLLADVAATPLEDAALAQRNVPFPGRWLHAPLAQQPGAAAALAHEFGDHERALFYLERAAEVLGFAPGSQELRQFAYTEVELGAQMLGARRKADASRLLARAVVHDPSNAAAWYYSGLLHLSERRGAEAKTALMKSLELDPTSALAWTRLSDVLVAAGDSVGAADAAKRALALNAELPAAWVASGMACLGAKNATDAEIAFRKALALDAAQHNAWIGVSFCRSAAQDRAGAVEALRRAEKIAPDDERVRSLLAALGEK